MKERKKKTDTEQLGGAATTNELMTFNNAEFGSIRTVVINGGTWLVGKDVAASLGYTDTFGALKKHVDEEDKQNCQNDSFESPRGMLVINESGLYSLVLASKLPRAKVFKRWVTSEVLPSIRKSGGYISGQEDLSPQELMAKALMVAQKTLEERETRILALTAENEDQKKVIASFEPMKKYIDTILSSPGTMKTSQIAADYGMTARKLNSILHEERIQRKVGTQWILYANHMNKGYTKSETFEFYRHGGIHDCNVQTVWTQKGRLLIHEILTNRGIVANADKNNA